MSIRNAEFSDLSRIAEIYVFNNRVNFLPIYEDINLTFGELQVVSLVNEYFSKVEILHVDHLWALEKNPRAIIFIKDMDFI